MAVDAETQGPAAAVFGVMFKNQVAAFVDAGQGGQLPGIILALAVSDLVVVQIVIDTIIAEGRQPALVDGFFEADLVYQVVVAEGKDILIIQPFRGGSEAQQKLGLKVSDDILIIIGDGVMEFIDDQIVKGILGEGPPSR